MSNAGRQFLVTKMICAACKGPLNLSYDVPKGTRYSEGEPTGARMVEQYVSVEPCETCLRPAREVLDAVAILTAAASNRSAAA